MYSYRAAAVPGELSTRCCRWPLSNVAPDEPASMSQGRWLGIPHGLTGFSPRLVTDAAFHGRHAVTDLSCHLLLFRRRCARRAVLLLQARQSTRHTEGESDPPDANTSTERDPDTVEPASAPGRWSPCRPLKLGPGTTTYPATTSRTPGPAPRAH